MSDFTVRTSTGSYSVHISPGSVDAELAGASVVIADDRFEFTDRQTATGSTVILVPGSEKTKTLSGCEEIIVAMKEAGVRRGDTVVALGGGAIQDAATFVASFYMRGLPWVYCPSTAMAMADSCIGGKSSINVGGIKNLGGNIYPPRHVVIDPTLATSLPLEAKVSGLAEAVKICFAAGPESFERYLSFSLAPGDFGPNRATEDLLTHVLLAKKWFIEVDEHDRAERQLLNFGHTFAHALEAATRFSLPHGVAVALGVIAALAHPASSVTASTVQLQDYCAALLRPVITLVESGTADIDWDLFESAVSADKKGTTDAVRLVLPRGAEGLALVALPRHNDTVRVIREAMATALDMVST